MIRIKLFQLLEYSLGKCLHASNSTNLYLTNLADYVANTKSKVLNKALGVEVKRKFKEVQSYKDGPIGRLSKKETYFTILIQSDIIALILVN